MSVCGSASCAPPPRIESMPFQHFEQICQAMANPAMYPHRVTRLERRDTHISAVFLTGEWAYKLKKPVDFGFLNFESLEARRKYCEQEVVLNQRLSRAIYQGVVEIREDESGRFSLEGDGRVVEYAVKMAQLPEDASLQSLLQGREVAGKDLKKLGYYLAAFYERSEQSPEIDHYGDPEVIAFNMEENFRQLERFVGDLVESEKWEFIRQVSRVFFRNWQKLFKHRVETNRIRDGHGDLRAEHIYLHNGIQIIDCVEFNERFRYGDAAIDLAFLHMDLERLGFADLSRTILAAYVEQADDPELYSLIDFYAAYRAVVKLKVACLRSSEESEADKARIAEEARGYLQQAYRYALQFSRPTLWVFCGLPATGKSALSRQIAEDLSLELLQSDQLRTEGEGCPMSAGVVPYGEGPYRLEMRHRVYAQMFAKAQERLKSGRSVALDGSFSRAKWRLDASRLAADLDTNFILVECTCSDENMRKRLLQREDDSGLSHARVHHLPQMKKAFEPVEELPAQVLLRVNTDRPFLHVLDEILKEGYARKCAQIADIV